MLKNGKNRHSSWRSYSIIVWNQGKRWEEWKHYTELRKNEGESWVYANEIPKDYKKVENGCYW